MNIDTNLHISYPLSRDQVVQLLKKYSITPTRQRIEIASFMFQRRQHLSADKILDGVNATGHRVSRATVYNTMGLFTKKGLIKEVLIDRERIFYDSNISDHHHIYNINTGELKDTHIELAGIPEINDDVDVVSTDVIIRVSG